MWFLWGHICWNIQSQRLGCCFLFKNATSCCLLPMHASQNNAYVGHFLFENVQIIHLVKMAKVVVSKLKCTIFHWICHHIAACYPCTFTKFILYKLLSHGIIAINFLFQVFRMRLFKFNYIFKPLNRSFLSNNKLFCMLRTYSTSLPLG